MKARALFGFSRRFEDVRQKIAFSGSFLRFCGSRWSSPSFFVRFRSASWVCEARLWRTNGFFVRDSLRGASPTCAIFAFLRRGVFFGCEREFSRRATTSAVFLDRAEYVGEESDGVSLLFLFSRRAGDVCVSFGVFLPLALLPALRNRPLSFVSSFSSEDPHEGPHFHSCTPLRGPICQCGAHAC